MASYTPLKVVVYLFNFLLMLCGLALMVGGTTFQIYYNDYLRGLETHLFIAPILFIIIGAVIFLVAVLSCFGACKFHAWALILVATLLAIVFVAEVAGCITAYVERRSVYNSIEKRMTDSLAHVGTDLDNSPEFKVWNRLQREFKCCAITTYTQWLNSTQIKKIPVSCCIDELDTSCKTLIYDPDGAGKTIKAKCDNPSNVNTCPIYTRGCLPTTEEFVRANIAYVGAIGLGVVAFQIIGAVLLSCLAKRIRNDVTI